MGSIADIFTTFTDAIFSFIDAGSAAADGILDTGSAVAGDFEGIVKGALGSLSE